MYLRPCRRFLNSVPEQAYRQVVPSGRVGCASQEFNSVEAIKSAVQHGLGLAFVSVLSIEKELQLGLLGCVSISGVTLTRPLMLITNPARTLSQAAQKFMKACPPPPPPPAPIYVPIRSQRRSICTRRGGGCMLQISYYGQAEGVSFCCGSISSLKDTQACCQPESDLA